MKKFYCLLFSFSFLIMLNAQPTINLVQVGTGFSRPVDIKNCGDGRIFIVEKVGRIKIMSKTGVVNSTAFLDITNRVQSSGNEQGLLGLAFSPNFKQDGYFYVNYINGSGAGSTRISRFSVLASDSNQADPNSEVILLTFTQPYTNHNGGSVQFGPDGYLYDSQGDGGSQNDPNGNGQNTNVYLAKLLRLDVQNQATYAIPADNPFAGQANSKPEVWAYGLRNPWRISFDRITGDLWIGDVGQGTYEEIDFQAKGDTGGHNYGWRCREGMHNTSNQSGCPGSGYTEPVFEYSHSNYSSCSVTGGYVYRGAQYNALWGRYLFTDYCSGRFWSVKQTGPNTFDPDTLQDFTNNQYMSFGEDNNGELYVAAENGGIYRITESSDCKPVAFISFSDSTSLCAGEKLVALKGDTIDYEWYNSSGAIVGVTGNEYEVPASGWYKVRAVQANTGCSSMSDSIYVTLNQPTALVPCNCNTDQCADFGSTSLSNFITPTGGVFSGSGVSGSNFNPGVAGVGTHSISYTYENQFGCVSSTSFSILVKDTTALTLPGANLNYCSVDTAVSISGIVQPGGGVFNSNLVTNDTIFHPNAAGAGMLSLPYSYTAANGCTSAISINLQVGDSSALSLNATTQQYCDNETQVALDTVFSPAGGVYAGTGVTGNTFNASAAGVGVHSINYSYTNSFGCVSSADYNFTVAVCGGISELAADINLQVSPNPNKGLFSITLKSDKRGEVQLQLFDAVGRVCWSKNVNLNNSPVVADVDVQGLAKGNYSLITTMNGRKMSHKVVLQ